jgi:hypothetical protein
MKKFCVNKQPLQMKKYCYYLRLISFVFVLASCGEKNNTIDNNALNEALEEEKKQPLQFTKNTVDLSASAKAITDEWAFYVAMEGEISRMKEYNIQDAMTNSFTILQAADTLQKTAPKRFRQTPIQSRAKVLHAKASILYQLSEKQIPDVEKIKKTAEEIPVDFYNLTIQLNEVFLETPNFEEM